MPVVLVVRHLACTVIAVFTLAAAGSGAGAAELMDVGEAKQELRPADAFLLSQREAAVKLTGTDGAVDAPQRLFLSGNASLLAGFDSNINSATDASTILLPLTNSTYSYASASPVLVAHASNFVGTTLGGRAIYAQSAQARWLANASAQLRINPNELAYLPHNYAAEAAFQYASGPTETTLSLSNSQQWLLRYQAVTRTSLLAQLAYQPSNTWRYLGALEMRRVSYPYFSPTAARGRFFHAALTDLPDGLTVRASYGQESSGGKAVELDRTITHLGLSWDSQTDPHRWRLHGAETRFAYSDDSPLFLVRRADRNRLLAAEYEYSLGGEWRAWRFITHLVSEENISNILISAYTRKQLIFEIRKDF